MKNCPDVEVVFVSPGAIAIIDSGDYDRFIATNKSGFDFLVKPREAKWKLHKRQDGLFSAITSLPIPNGSSIGITLHSLVASARDSAKPINGSYLDCRSVNWEVEKHMRRCELCGELFTRRKFNKKQKDANELLVYILDGEKIARKLACSKTCKTKAENRARQDLRYAAKSSITESVVYFAESRSEGRIKIGFSTDVESRLKSLKTGCPSGLFLIGTIPGDFELEKKWHTQWASNRISGEWFKKTPDLNAAIRAAVEVQT